MSDVKRNKDTKHKKERLINTTDTFSDAKKNNNICIQRAGKLKKNAQSIPPKT